MPHPHAPENPAGQGGSPQPLLGLLVLPLLLTLCCLLVSPVPAARAALLHLEGPLPADLGVSGSGLAPCGSPASRPANTSIPGPMATS